MVMSIYIFLTFQCLGDISQIVFINNYNLLEWSLNSPPKAPAFVSLPTQISAFSLGSLVKDNIYKNTTNKQLKQIYNKYIFY